MFQNKAVGLKPGWRGAICLEISTKPSDWITGTTEVNKSQLEAYANNFIRFSRLWLTARGYSPVEFRAVNGYDNERLGQLTNADNVQKQLRRAILADFLSPQNWNKASMSQWKGIAEDSPHVGQVLNYPRYGK